MLFQCSARFARGNPCEYPVSCANGGVLIPQLPPVDKKYPALIAGCGVSLQVTGVGLLHTTAALLMRGYNAPPGPLFAAQGGNRRFMP